jgi:predicted ATP-dependent serine protease
MTDKDLGVLQTYSGSRWVSGDPQCSLCGGTEFRWEGKCVKCVDKEIDRWEELKGQIEHAIEQAELGLAVAEDPKSFPKRTVEAQYGDILYHRGKLAELRKIEKIIEKLENS